jgi:photosystem II stability/assembly factor-like uncharacterized protein
MKKLFTIIICCLALSGVNYGQWQEANNGLFGGHIGGVFVDPATSLVFVGTRYCGIFVTSDDGKSWKTSNKGLTSDAINIESFVRSGRNIFAGCSYSSGVFLSTDNGKSWVNKRKGLPNVYVNSLALAGTKLIAGCSDGLFLSADNGENWTSISNGLSGMPLYIGSLAVKGDYIFVGTTGGLYRSNDFGGTWTRMNLGLTYDYVRAMAVDENHIYAGAVMGKVCISTDDGNSWTLVETGLPFGTDIQSMTLRGNTIYAGTYNGGVTLSTDNGLSWKQVNNGLSSLIVNKIAVKENKIFAATEGGVFLSTNNGASWTAINKGIKNLVVTSVVETGGKLIAGTNGNGLFISRDKGNSWAPLNLGLTDFEAHFFNVTAKGTNVFAGSQDGLFYSNDSGTTWKKASFNQSYSYSIGVFAFAFTGEKIYAATIEGIFESTDNGKTWSTKNALKNEGLYSLATNGNNIFAGTFSGLYLSTDFGNTWSNISSGLSLTDNCIWSIVTKDNSVYFACFDGVFVSTDNGVSWKAINNGLPHLNTFVLAIKGNNLFTATYNDGIFLSTNNGSNWTQINSGLEGPALTSGSLSIIGDYIYSGTNKGVWKRALSDFLTLSVSPNSLNIAALEDSKAVFSISSNSEWSVTSFEEWLTISKVSGSGNEIIELTAAANHSKDPRKAIVTVSAIGVKSQSIVVTQDARKCVIDKNDILIYPNPAKDNVSISIGDAYFNPGYSLRIMNVLGTVVFETNINQSRYDLDISSWTIKGSYVLQVRNSSHNVVAVKTIIVQ